MSAVEEMLGLFQRYECFEQAPAVVKGHFCEGQHFGGEQSLEGFDFSSFWRYLIFLVFVRPILGGSKEQHMWLVNFEVFLENVRSVIKP